MSNGCDRNMAVGETVFWGTVNNALERYRFREAQEFWPLMNTDERGFFDSLTERVIGAVFEVSNTLGAGSSRKSMSALCSGNSAFAASGLSPKLPFR